jgi:hypothetical protein
VTLASAERSAKNSSSAADSFDPRTTTCKAVRMVQPGGFGQERSPVSPFVFQPHNVKQNSACLSESANGSRRPIRSPTSECSAGIRRALAGIGGRPSKRCVTGGLPRQRRRDPTAADPVPTARTDSWNPVITCTTLFRTPGQATSGLSPQDVPLAGDWSGFCPPTPPTREWAALFGSEQGIDAAIVLGRARTH